MSKALKSALIIGGVLVVVVVVVVAALEAFSHRLHDNPAATLTFATSARTLHEKLDPDLLPNLTILADRIAGDTSANASEIQAGLISGALAASGYRNQFTYIQPTSDALDLYNALRKEASSIVTGYTRLNEALSARQVGNLDLSNTRLEEARSSRDQAAALRQQNSAALDNLIASARARLEE